MDNGLERTQKMTREDFPVKNIPLVCSWCKKIYSIEQWKFEDDQKTGVSHGICPSCMKKLQTQISTERKEPQEPEEPSAGSQSSKQLAWVWVEAIQRGVDYSSAEEVRAYDKRMSELRDIEGENLASLKDLGAKFNSRLLDIGAGTGSFVITAAHAGCRVVAVDVSNVMLEYAAAKAYKADVLKSVDFKQGGFLSIVEEPGSFDGIEASLSLHHLPDLWKAVALDKLYAFLKPGGRLHIRDLVFSKTGEGWDAYFERVVLASDSSSAEVAKHIAQEYSTLDWIMTGLLERAGFRIISDNALPNMEWIHSIVAEKPLEPEGF